MKVFMISMDPKLADPMSEVSERTSFYASSLEKLRVVLLKSYGKSFPQKIISFFTAWQEGRNILKKEAFDIITSQDPFATGLLGYLLKIEFRLPFQLQIHTGLFTPYFWNESLKNKLFVLLSKFLLRRADCIRVVSLSIRDYLIKEFGLKDSKISVLPVYVDIERFLNYGEVRVNLKEKYPHFDFIILMASRFFPQKNIGLAIKAMAKLIKKYPRLGLIIVGSGPEERKLKIDTASYKLQINIIFEPWSEDIRSYYKTADLFLLTSNYEGFARTVLEAMAAGLPVVMTNVGLAGEVVKNGENGIVIPVGDQKALLEAVIDLYQNPEKRRRLARAGQETVKTLPFVAKEEYLAFYRESFEICLRPR